MKKILSLLLALCLLPALTACGGKGASSSAEKSAAASSKAEPVEITVFAAASMTETLNQIIEAYKTAAPNVTVTPSYESSGALLDQIEQGAECNLFISAAQKQMDALDGSLTSDKAKNPDGQDMLVSGSRVNILENKVVLVVPGGNPAGIKSFSDLKTDKLKLIALGGESVPVGSYSLDILKYLGLDITALENAGKVTYGSNVKEVTTQVDQGAVDCGIIYATDAYSAQAAGSKMEVVDTASGDMCKPVLYPAAVLNTTTDTAKLDAAQAFLDYLRTDACSAIFEKVGFTVVK
ncbi:MAG: molybdate ABC transporter substrate-binding protein [Oscillibacter sp.]|jgi:molybdate transport system substrate-binding protein|nr:molybdate ABC transporter substrate-binding protein [Oscillibacter sp.]